LLLGWVCKGDAFSHTIVPLVGVCKVIRTFYHFTKICDNVPARRVRSRRLWPALTEVAVSRGKKETRTDIHERAHQHTGALHKHTHRKQESQVSNPGQQPSTLRPSHESANTPRLARRGSTDQREFNRALTSAALAAPPPPLVLIVWSPLVPSIAWSPLTGCVVRVVVCSDPDVLFVARVSANLLCCS